MQISSRPRTTQLLLLVLALASVALTLWYALQTLAQPAARSVTVDQLTREYNKYITAPDTTPRGVRYRWVPSDTSVRIPLPYAQGILRTDTWVWPDATGAVIQVDTQRYPIPAVQAIQPRRYAIFGSRDAWQTQRDYTVTVSGPKAFWAFSGVTYVPIHALPATSLLVLYACVTAVLSGIALRWRAPFGLALALSQWVIAVWIAQTTPLALYLPTTLARTDIWSLATGIVATVGILVFAPRARAWYRAASGAQRVTVLTTALCCVAPLVATLYGPEPLAARVTENRRLTAFPDTLPASMDAFAAAATQSEQWLSDHYGWRSTLIRVKNELDYRVFGTSSRVFYGKNDVFYMRRWTDERFPALDAALRDPARRAALTARIKTRVKLYTDLGIRPIMVIAPSKEIIYPEFLPWYVPRYDTTLLRGYIAELNALGIEVIDGEQLLLAAKPTQPMLFHKQDFHWNRVAAHLVADEVLQRVATTIPPARPFRRPVTIVDAPSPFADRDFAALWFDRYAVPAGHDIALPLPPGGEWRNTSELGVAMDIWENPRADVAFPQQNLQIIGDSFSVRFVGAGFEYGFPAIYRSFYPTETTAYPQWLRDHHIGVVLWQLRDGGLTYFLDGLAEQ